jgi:hypothetical protein
VLRHVDLRHGLRLLNDKPVATTQSFDPVTALIGTYGQALLTLFSTVSSLMPNTLVPNTQMPNTMMKGARPAVRVEESNGTTTGN